MLFEQNNAFYNYQIGFRNNHSTNLALIEITEQIRNACNKNLFTCGVYPQSSVFGPLLFILFIKDMHNSVEYCKVHHYAHDTHLLLTDNSLRKINRKVNRDLSLICHWLRGKKYK